MRLMLERVLSGWRGDRPACRPAFRLASVLAGSALVLVSCTQGSAPAPPSQPTVQTAATQVSKAASPAAATAQAAASPVAGTAQALASPALATAQALASPQASPSPSPAAGVPGDGAALVRIADASLADATPWVSLQNQSEVPIDVGGWQLSVGSSVATLPTDIVVEPGETVTLHAGVGESSGNEIFLGEAGEALANAAEPGTPVRLTDGAGNVVTETTVPRFW